MYAKLFSIAVLAAGASAMTITELALNHLPQACSDQCNAWVTQVGNCVTGLNATFSASVNTGDLGSLSLNGDASLLPPCLCSAEAVQASESCLSCASTNLCITPPLTMQDYSMTCQNPMAAWDIFKRYHNLDTCSASSSTEGESSSTESSSTESSSTEGGGATDSSSSESMTSTESSSESMTPTESSSESMTPTESSSSSESMSSTDCTVTVTPVLSVTRGHGGYWTRRR